jgi:hypothetical protein
MRPEFVAGFDDKRDPVVDVEDNGQQANIPTGRYLKVCDPQAVQNYDFVLPMLAFCKECMILEHPECHSMPKRLKDLIKEFRKDVLKKCSTVQDLFVKADLQKDFRLKYSELNRDVVSPNPNTIRQRRAIVGKEITDEGA